MCLLAGALLASGQSVGADAARVTTEHVDARLVSELNTVQQGQPFWVALHFDIKPGWHTYWLNPGDSGAAPTLAWKLPPGFSASEIHWPYPQRLPVGPLMNFGYSDAATMLVRITPPPVLEPGSAITLVVEAKWLVCEEICIPESGRFSLALRTAPQAQRDERWAPLIDAARSRVPRPLPGMVTVTSDSETLTLRVESPTFSAQPIEQAIFFPMRFGVIEHAASQTFRHQSTALLLSLSRGALPDGALGEIAGVLRIEERTPQGTLSQAFSIAATPTAQTDVIAAEMGLAAALALALLGGLLLNVMPCVLPVLSIKALALAADTQATRRQTRLQGLAFTAGVLGCFAILAVVLIGLKQGGVQIGWGFQLQQPLVVMGLSWLLLLLGLMLSGSWQFGARFMGLGQGLTQHEGLRGALFTGALAVVVATPCTAPFMGVAVGYGLTQSWPVTLAVFLALGTGLAAPWLALSWWPRLARWLPKPGAWMERLKQLLAFPLYGSAVWLVWVLARQSGADAAGLALMGGVVLALLIWLAQQPVKRALARNVAVLACIATLVTIGVSVQRMPTLSPGDSRAGLDAEPYSASRLAALRAEERAVLVNMTAAWCITCLVNEQVALSTNRVRQLLEDKEVTYLKGDWTRHDPAITAYLERFGRSGVPLYVLYPPDNAAEPVVLPQLLSVGIVEEHLNRLP